MSSSQVSSATEGTPEAGTVDLKLEVVVLPVSDVDRARDFYVAAGFRLDADFAAGDSFRVVQLTPPGSDASIIFGTGVTSAAPGSTQELQLVVADLGAARAALAAGGVDVSEEYHDAGGIFHHAGSEGRVPGPGAGSYGSFASFSDPDGNGWVVQEVTTRLPGRVTGPTTYASANDLRLALERAAAAHGEHEARTGEADAEWPVWYADYMVRERAGEELPT
jgi:catechol 2,3-dioxygenase-like lactoylglutathione lyase family enzyme